eukprot:CAMPEP_0119270750 /NCGR_PEP_ID=MMETSP1329-20130426/7632_1 /TAXON_ID=114041 /ORGANISM="Genus nov. species nov., Strain RCC1024" /LENGTH=151 /DNA_ID=CAMNT_0007270781 /DNA_START=154 /DNA_END=605 /DNA_ORIENTATION=+
MLRRCAARLPQLRAARGRRAPPRALSKLTHVDEATNRPTMVDVSHKATTARRAVARCRITFPEAAFRTLADSGFESKKGPVLSTAVIAGVMGAKKTHHLVPFCHGVALDACDITFDVDAEARALDVTCAAKTAHRTGVEMEALAGCSVAAL